MGLIDQFALDFRLLTKDGKADGHLPLRWQIRLFQSFYQNNIPLICDLPTGMGKTSVVHLWLLARRRQELENKASLPTRLVYVVDRRTVVDQATEIAEGIRRNLPSLGMSPDYLSISTLRGHFADNREWTRDPSRPAIIIGTVDMIGSRLLFSGYRSSYKQRPLEAGLLGQDTLLVLDEAHLSEPFQKLIVALSDRGEFQRDQGSPMRVMCMSATSSKAATERFKLESCDLEGDQATNPIIQRYAAKKRLDIRRAVDKIKENIIAAAIDLAQGNDRVVVFVRGPEDAGKIAEAIRKKLKGREDAVRVLTGTMRGLERDRLLETTVLKRFLDGNEKAEDKPYDVPAILVSTSAGEVGFDLNADHMVCDAVPLDSMIQRLGRVNRRGYGDAIVQVFVAKPDEKPPKKDKQPNKKSTWESAVITAIECLQLLEKNDDGTFAASPMAIDDLKNKLANETFEAALTPKPATVTLTDVLLDSWSMTSVTERMPGRPPVAPWLRGLVDEEPQTTIAWRAELDIDGFDQLEIADLEDWFDAHRILPHETLSVPTRAAREWILARWKNLASEPGSDIQQRSCFVDCGLLEAIRIKSLIEDLDRKRIDKILNATVVLPNSFCGISTEGLLDKDASNPPDVADLTAEHKRQRVLCESVDDVKNYQPLVGEALLDSDEMAELALDLSDDGDTRRVLISRTLKPWRPEYGTQRQTLEKHVSLVERCAKGIAERLSLPVEICDALESAAAWHDKGKDRLIWQRAAGRKPEEPPVGKSGGRMGRIAKGYRHEFGSLYEFNKKHRGKKDNDVFDLAMHMIASHHGRGRPHFPKGGFEPEDRANSFEIDIETIRRFARLQRKYGYWRLAWLENLLRCADATASADEEGL